MSANLEQLKQLTSVTWDGNLISKTARDELVKTGLVARVKGFNYITEDGIKTLLSLGEIKS